MSDDEEMGMHTGIHASQDSDKELTKPTADNHSSTSDDDDSSSSSSGSSSSSDSSDSESDNDETTQPQTQTPHEQYADRKYSFESVASSNGRARSDSIVRSSGANASTAEPLTDVNSNRAAARFREQNSTVGLMALGTKKRDRRTIEEIQRDLQKKRSRPGVPSTTTNGTGSKLLSGAGAAPRSSPALSPEPPPHSNVDAAQLGVGLPPIKMPKGKLTSARSRLTQKLMGRGGGGSSSSGPAKPVSTAGGGGGGGSMKKNASGNGATTAAMTTNVSSAAKAAKNDLDAYVAEQRAVDALATSTSIRQQQGAEPSVPRTIEWRPDGKVVRAILRSLLRFGDLTDVGLCPSRRDAYADVFRLANFVVRSNLTTTTKASEEKLLKTASDIADRVQRAIEDRQDAIRYVDVEIKPSQVVERLYENLKLRVAVQRALRDARYPKTDDRGAYVLIAKQADLPTLGIARDFSPWFWAEKEHDWNSRKDAALLLGIYVHGFGAWEDILNDDLLHFHQQRALKGERMKKRAENLLKRLPAPDDTGDMRDDSDNSNKNDPRIVQLANALAGGAGSNSSQSVGAVFNAIINNSNVGTGNSAIHAASNVVGVVNSGLNKARMQRAADRIAARAGSNSSSSANAVAQRPVVPEDSIRRAHTQATAAGNNSATDRHRKLPTPPPIAAAAATAATALSDDEPEDGEVDAAPTASSSAVVAPPPLLNNSSTNSAKRPLASPSKASTKQDDKHAVATSESARKRSKASAERSAARKAKSKATNPSPSTALSAEASVDKWTPSKQLKDIRTVLKKMKIMANWSTDQKDEVVVEKVLKYVTTIGAAIDAIVLQAERDSHEWDELCSCLWAYAATYTPFAPVAFERLYDDICADGDALRRAGVGAAGGSDAVGEATSGRPSAAAST